MLLQEAAFVYDPEVLEDNPKEVNHDVLFREGKTVKVIRLCVIDCVIVCFIYNIYLSISQPLFYKISRPKLGGRLIHT